MKKNNTLSRFLKTSFLLMAVGALVSCQKEINPLEEENNNEPGTGAPVPTGSSYMPYSKGSSWTYQDSAVTNFKTVMVATDVSKTIAGISYKQYDVVEGINDVPVYYGNIKNDYYMLLEAGAANGATIDINMLFLNDKESVGYTWTKDAGTANGFPARIKGKISAKGITKTWVGKTYKDIIHTSVDLEYNLMGNWMPMGTYQFYCAKGIGLVKTDYSLSMLGQTYTSTASYLVDYTIK
jgi:hypothetical protein